VTARPLTGAARIAGVAGSPIVNTLSPALHGAWIAALGLDAAYVPFGPRDDDGFRALVAAGRAGALRGLNVTAPFKPLALSLADEASATAGRTGSANLLLFEDGRVRADSTDGEGLMAALAEQAPELSLAGRTAVLLGAGGAARAAVDALAQAGAEVRIVNRTRDRAEALAAEVGGEPASWDEAAPPAALVVNALSIQPAVDLRLLPPDAVVMDMTYRPVVTPFLTAARARGLTPVDGLAMLIGQARPTFRALFGAEPPDMDIRALLLDAIAR
jgi:shikimate dehydrogenase